SRTLKTAGPNATVIATNVEAFVRKLKEDVDGEIDVAGPSLAASLTELGLVDEASLTELGLVDEASLTELGLVDEASLTELGLVDEASLTELGLVDEASLTELGLVDEASLTELGLVDEYRLYYRPFVLGAGKPYFAGVRPALRIVASDRFGEEAVRLTCIR